MSRTTTGRGALSLYQEKRWKARTLTAFLVIALPAAALFSLTQGVMGVPPDWTARIIAGKIAGLSSLYAGFPAGATAVVWEIRLPRILCGLCIGAALGASGVIFQAILQNQLADPYTVGVSSGASFGASLAIFCNTVLAWRLPITPAALAFAGATLAVVIFIAEGRGGLETTNLIMAGIIVSAVFQAGLSFLKMLSGENVSAIVFWLMGSLAGRDWKDAALLAVTVIPAVVLAAAFSGDLNILSLGDREARSLGLNAKRTRFLFLLLGACMTAVCVSVAGIIGFVGLVVPHLLRFSVSSDNRLLTPLSALLGAVLLTAADTAVRLIGSGEIPVGVLTTLLGGPFFIWIFMKRKNGGRS
ncbi:MAG: iron ABC transporter permease [Treponema sp.]|jgi:iron complex transport system permease protein|nr:iron ABC transporter permease [Treponema sp.]